MSFTQARSGRLLVLRQVPRLTYAGYGALALIVAAWAWRAFHDPSAYDTGAAWIAGEFAWKTGHPEALQFWTGLPSLAGAMALVSRVLSIKTTGQAMTVLNLVVAVGAGAYVLHRIRSSLSGVWWWIAAFGLVSFGPLMSTVWWKQFNLISLVLAAAGFELVRHRRNGWGGWTIGLSIAIKPMVILLPFVMLARRETRRAGAVALVWLFALNMAAQALMAARAGQIGPLDPLSGVRNLLNKTKPNKFLCHPLNFSPGSLLCRSVAGFQFWTLQRIAVWCLLLLLGAWVISALRGHSILGWEAFAFICALSAMTSPWEWNHYQLLLVPLFLLLLVRFVRDGAGVGSWLGLAVAFVLASLIWEPYGTLVGTVRQALTGRHQNYNVLLQTPGVTFQEGIAEFAQYVLIISGALWFSGRLVVRPLGPLGDHE